VAHSCAAAVLPSVYRHCRSPEGWHSAHRPAPRHARVACRRARGCDGLPAGIMMCRCGIQRGLPVAVRVLSLVPRDSQEAREGRRLRHATQQVCLRRPGSYAADGVRYVGEMQ